MKLDLHVHTTHSGHTTIYPLSLIMQESYNTPEGVYRRAKARGMDLVDHHRPRPDRRRADHRGPARRHRRLRSDGRLPERRRRVHLGVLGVTEGQHAEIQRLRHDVRDLMPYLKQQGIFTSLNHVASRINGAITAAHIAALMPWVDGIEVLNGSRLPTQNRTAACLADACRKVGVGGSDSHTRPRHRPHVGRGARRATDREEFMTGTARRTRARGRPAGQLLHDGLRHDAAGRAASTRTV